ncbi:hypothetical protein [Brevundimonas naejangsanensis]|uniref:hypothetical protein n=1 Tax=Brevundimonas naejangsanensis TaxID=588932 RepID=UPI00106DB645|nr:hypothetical protein [Brevundimonas naejangsanensis]QBQ49517.1 hypothetical protein E3U41_12950 [Brevundimonas naejangsanensis]
MNGADDTDDLLFSNEDIERWKRGEQPEGWLEHRKDVLLARCRAQTKRLLASSSPATTHPMNQPL